ncbi:MAG: ATP-binding protein [Oleibacter sp.]|nr:ATP-binding protein [Thalassolituus sp.]
MDDSQSLLGERSPQTSQWLAAFYVIISVLFALFNNKNTNSQIIIGYLFIEILLLTALMHFSGGLQAGFSSILFVPLIVANLITPGVFGYAVAAWLTLAVTYSEFMLNGTLQLNSSANTGLYGAASFVIAFLVQLISSRSNAALDLASFRQDKLMRLRRLNKHALNSLPDGIIACDAQHRITYLNPQAASWFSLQEQDDLPNFMIGNTSPRPIRNATNSFIIMQFDIPEGDGDYFLMIEDGSRVAAEAQQVKLASLGRLTSSIAHEIRNPLSALHQATQLVSEANYLQPEERELIEIIEDNGRRINRIIEDILQLSQGHKAVRLPLNVTSTLTDFKREFEQFNSAQDYQFTLNIDADIYAFFDRDHLKQVLHNLCKNGLRHARKAKHHQPKISISVTLVSSGQVQMDINDNGDGVDPESRHQLFEPFNTTEDNGTGLGLYICRELCQANQATIHYQQQSTPGACFRILMQQHLSTDVKGVIT